jgi:hypothetical protein
MSSCFFVITGYCGIAKLYLVEVGRAALSSKARTARPPGQQFFIKGQA